MNKPTRLKVVRPDIPPEIAARPRHVELTPDEERAFLQKLAGYEAAYRQTGDPFPLWEALIYVESSGQTVPHWLADAFLPVAILALTPNEMKRADERWLAVRRYVCVRDLRATVDELTGQKYTKDEAVDQALIQVRAEGDKGVRRRGKLEEGVSRRMVEVSYDKVRKDLERRGCESEYYVVVERIERLVLTQAGLGYSSYKGPICYPCR